MRKLTVVQGYLSSEHVLGEATKFILVERNSTARTRDHGVHEDITQIPAELINSAVRIVRKLNTKFCMVHAKTKKSNIINGGFQDSDLL